MGAATLGKLHSIETIIQACLPAATAGGGSSVPCMWPKVGLHLAARVQGCLCRVTSYGELEVCDAAAWVSEWRM